MKVFSKEKYIKWADGKGYNRKKFGGWDGWVDKCDGKPVHDGLCGSYGVVDEWCIDVPDAVNCKCVVKTREGQKGEKKMYTMKDFTDKKIAIRIPDRETADKVMQACHDAGVKWRYCTDPLDYDPVVGKERCVEFDYFGDKTMTQGKCSNTAKHGYKIVNFDEVQLATAPRYKITIECDGKTTTARMEINGKEVKTAKARRNPADKFDWRIGAETAFNRLFGKKEEKKPGVFKVGDRVVCVADTVDHKTSVAGKHGVVRALTGGANPVGVEFDEDVRGHCLERNAVECKDGHGWYLAAKDLRHE